MCLPQFQDSVFRNRGPTLQTALATKTIAAVFLFTLWAVWRKFQFSIAADISWELHIGSQPSVEFTDEGSSISDMSKMMSTTKKRV